MKATGFEFRHQKLLHLLIVSAAACTYLIDGEDVVWRFVKNTATPHTSERAAFLAAAVLVAAGAVLCTWARAHEPAGQTAIAPSILRLRYLGEFCYAIGLGSLLPLAGLVILVAGEGLRVLRLTGRMADEAQHPISAADGPPPQWSTGVRREAVKWGILLTMVVFVITLRDRYADVLVLASFAVGSLLSIR